MLTEPEFFELDGISTKMRLDRDVDNYITLRCDCGRLKQSWFDEPMGDRGVDYAAIRFHFTHCQKAKG